MIVPNRRLDDDERRLLIVGDGPRLARLPLASIAARGYQVRTTRNDPTLAAVTREVAPHIVAAFVELGDDGHSATIAAVRRVLPTTRFVPLLAIYPQRSPGEISIGTEQGADDFLAEPYEDFELLLRLDVLWRMKGLRDAVLLSNERLKAMAITDELTGLLKQNEFRRRMEMEVRRIRRFRIPVACVFFDCDNFKQVNDSYGHEAGSFVLKEVGRLIVDNLRETDIVSRYGGDEFVIGMPGCGTLEAGAVARRLTDTVRSHVFMADKAQISITLSMGVASATPADPHTVEVLLERADQALYEAKRKGRDQVVLFSEALAKAP